jgi:hypothetical protein
VAISAVAWNRRQRGVATSVYARELNYDRAIRWKRAPATTRNNNHLTSGSLPGYVCEMGSQSRSGAEGIVSRRPVPAPPAHDYHLP